MKRALLLSILGCLLVVGASACDESDTEPTTTQEPPPEVELEAPTGLEFASPTNGTTVDADTVDVTVTWAGGDVRGLEHGHAGDTPTEVLGPFDDQRFTFTVDLDEGVNRVRVVLLGDEGTRLAGELVVIREAEEVVEPPPPVPVTFDITAPPSGTVLDGTTQAVEVTWSGAAPTELTYTVDGGATVAVDGPFSGTSHGFEVEIADEGVHTVRVTMAFEDGEPRADEIVLVQPAVERGLVFTSEPADGTQTEDASIVLRGTVVSPHPPEGVAVDSGAGTVDAEVTEQEPGVWSWQAEVDLALGANTLVVTATFAELASASSRIEVTRLADGTSPWIEAVLPTHGHDVRGTQAFVRAVISDNVGVADAVLVTDDGAGLPLTSSDGVYTATLELTPGWNTFSIVATDAHGNQSERFHEVYQGSRLSSGGAHGAYLLEGDVLAWGRNNLGQVGLGYTSDIGDEVDGPHPLTPQPVTIGKDIVSVVVTQNTSIALDVDGQVWAWGDNGDGQLGLGTADPDDVFDDVDRYAPERIAGLAGIEMIARGFDHTLALDADGQVWAWGDNVDGQLGDGTTESRDVPVQVAGLGTAVSIAAASATSFAVLDDGTLWAWGENTYGNLGLGVDDSDAHPAPVQVPGLTDVIDVAAGRDHVLVLTASGALYTWGLNGSLQASPVEEDVLSPLLRDDITDVLQPVTVYAGGNQSFIEDAEGRLFGWGQNFQGNLGLIEDGEQGAPTEPVFGVSESVAVGIGALQGLVLRRDGRVFAWGWSFEGSLGGGDGVIDRWGYRVPILVALPGSE